MSFDADPIRIQRVLKPSGGERSLALLPGRTDRAYRRAVGAVLDPLEGSLGPEVLANRVVAAWSPQAWALEPWRPARARMDRSVIGEGAAAIVVTDVRECYASIAPGVVARTLCRLGVDASQRSAVMAVLEHTATVVPGLPVGPEPSGVLANAVLAPIDGALRECGVGFVRWVDDLVVAAPSRTRAARALLAIERAARDLGLELAPEKTRVVCGGARGCRIGRVAASASIARAARDPLL